MYTSPGWGHHQRTDVCDRIADVYSSKLALMPKHGVSYFKDENNSLSPPTPLLFGLLDFQEKEAVNY